MKSLVETGCEANKALSGRDRCHWFQRTRKSVLTLEESQSLSNRQRRNAARPLIICQLDKRWGVACGFQRLHRD